MDTLYNKNHMSRKQISLYIDSSNADRIAEGAELLEMSSAAFYRLLLKVGYEQLTKETIGSVLK
jgi:hypothetical protein